MTPGNDFDFWKWLFGLALSAVGGVIGGVWFSRGVLKDLQHTDADHSTRLLALETFKREQEAFCIRQKTELIELLQKEVCNVVRLAVKDITIEQNDKLSKIVTSIAVQSSMTSAIQTDIAEIFQRMNQRRKGEANERE